MSVVAIEKRGRRIEVRSEDYITGLKTAVPGAYQSVNGYWTVPLSMESCKLLRQKFGRRLVVGPQLSRWAKGIRHNRDIMAKLSSAEDVKLYVLPKEAPKLYRAMEKRKYQKVGVRFGADGPATLIADDPGLGKTLIGMGIIVESETPGPYLIIAPKTASETVWKREIRRWLPKHHKPIIMPDYRGGRERRLNSLSFDKNTWLIIHPEMAMSQTYLICDYPVVKRLRNRKTGERKKVKRPCGVHNPEGNKHNRILSKCKHIKTRKTKRYDDPRFPQLFQVEWGAIIIDESHQSLIRRSGAPTQRRRGIDKLSVRSDGLRIAMSGTPMNNKPEQLWGTLNWLNPKQYSAFHRWAELYWKKGGYTGWQIGEFIQEREPLLWDSLSAIVLRRTKAEVAEDLPPKVHVGTPLNPTDEKSPVGVWLDMEPKQAKAYAQMELDGEAQLESGRLEATSALAELTRLKQFASSYGRIETRKVKASCQRQNEIARPKFWCDECKARGWHVEYRDKFIPELPSNKFTWTVENLEEWGYPSNPLTKVIIVSFFTGLLQTVAANLEAHFKTKPNRPLTTAITGRTKMRDRASVIDRFNNSDDEHIMMLNVKAGGTAITIDSADRMIFLTETRIPDEQTQAEDRIHRVSNPRHCMYYYLRSVGSVDVGTAIVNQELAQQSHRVLDERRGVEYLRHVLDLSRG